jgi:hypothetical protein
MVPFPAASDLARGRWPSAPSDGGVATAAPTPGAPSTKEASGMGQVTEFTGVYPLEN